MLLTPAKKAQDKLNLIYNTKSIPVTTRDKIHFPSEDAVAVAAFIC